MKTQRNISITLYPPQYSAAAKTRHLLIGLKRANPFWDSTSGGIKGALNVNFEINPGIPLPAN